MNDSTNICLACGLCCDGTLIGFVHLDKKEIPRVKQLMTIEETHGEGFFLHPCNKYCKDCTVYAERPRQCAKFECGLLKSVDQEEMSFNTAVETVQLVKEQKISIEKKLATLDVGLKSPSFYFQMVEVKNLLQKKKAPLTPNHLELLTEIEELNSLLEKKFDVTLS